MSFGGTGGRTKMTSKVTLNLYDLSPANEYLYALGLGLHHSGIEILGTEYSFASGAGVFEAPPKVAGGAIYRESIELGYMQGGSTEVKGVLDELKQEFAPDKYNLIKKNCNHFANALAYALLQKQIPSHINRLANIGSCMSCLLPKQMLENAPVGDPNNQNSSSNSGYQVYPSRNQAQNDMKKSLVSAFSGSGMTLGSSSSSTSSSGNNSGLGNFFGNSGSTAGNKSGSDDLTDRREKAKMAAMARLNQKIS